MRIAIIADIHSNLEALEKTFETIEAKNVEDIVCLGDIVGYGANPNECLNIVKKKTQHIVLGNHEKAAANLAYAKFFTPYARTAVEWTAKELTEENRRLIETLPYTLEVEDVLYVHASPYLPHKWYYIFSSDDAFHNFSYFTTRLCFVGHTHVPEIFCEDLLTEELVRQKKFLINVGSVGQPRDNDPRLSFGILDTEQWQYENIRAEYDVQKAAEKIRKAGLPQMLADRLLVGR